MKGNVKEIDYKSAVDFLLPRHYAGRIPTISRAFGWFESGGADYLRFVLLVSRLLHFFVVVFAVNSTRNLFMS